MGRDFIFPILSLSLSLSHSLSLKEKESCRVCDVLESLSRREGKSG